MKSINIWAEAIYFEHSKENRKGLTAFYVFFSEGFIDFLSGKRLKFKLRECLVDWFENYGWWKWTFIDFLGKNRSENSKT